jgi:hypothetical protein
MRDVIDDVTDIVIDDGDVRNEWLLWLGVLLAGGRGDLELGEVVGCLEVRNGVEGSSVLGQLRKVVETGLSDLLALGSSLKELAASRLGRLLILGYGAAGKSTLIITAIR